MSWEDEFVRYPSVDLDGKGQKARIKRPLRLWFSLQLATASLFIFSCDFFRTPSHHCIFSIFRTVRWSVRRDQSFQLCITSGTSISKRDPALPNRLGKKGGKKPLPSSLVHLFGGKQDKGSDYFFHTLGGGIGLVWIYTQTLTICSSDWAGLVLLSSPTLLSGILSWE